MREDKDSVVNRERGFKMSKSNGSINNSGIYAQIRVARMSPVEREHAIDALHQAELLVNVILWVKGKFSALGHAFLKPSLKH